MEVDNHLPAGWDDTLHDYRIKRFWILGFIGLFIHGVIDPMTTYFTVSVHDVGREANPWLATHLQAGGSEFMLVHLPLYLMVGLVFVVFTWLFHHGSDTEKDQIYTMSLIFWAAVIIWGSFVVGNNILVLIDSSFIG